MTKKCLLCVTVSCTALALAVLYAILLALDFVLLNIDTCSNNVGKKVRV